MMPVAWQDAKSSCVSARNTQFLQHRTCNTELRPARVQTHKACSAGRRKGIRVTAETIPTLTALLDPPKTKRLNGVMLEFLLLAAVGKSTTFPEPLATRDLLDRATRFGGSSPQPRTSAAGALARGTSAPSGSAAPARDGGATAPGSPRRSQSALTQPTTTAGASAGGVARKDSMGTQRDRADSAPRPPGAGPLDNLLPPPRTLSQHQQQQQGTAMHPQQPPSQQQQQQVPPQQQQYSPPPQRRRSPQLAQPPLLDTSQHKAGVDAVVPSFDSIVDLYNQLMSQPPVTAGPLLTPGGGSGAFGPSAADLLGEGSAPRLESLYGDGSSKEIPPLPFLAQHRPPVASGAQSSLGRKRSGEEAHGGSGGGSGGQGPTTKRHAARVNVFDADAWDDMFAQLSHHINRTGCLPYGNALGDWTEAQLQAAGALLQERREGGSGKGASSGPKLSDSQYLRLTSLPAFMAELSRAQTAAAVPPPQQQQQLWHHGREDAAGGGGGGARLGSGAQYQPSRRSVDVAEIMAELAQLQSDGPR
jgi:hypothetical protein